MKMFKRHGYSFRTVASDEERKKIIIMQSITRPGVMIKMANILQKKMSEKERGIKIRNEIYDIILCTTYRASSKIGLQIMGGNGKIVGDHFGQDIKIFFLHRQKKLLFLCYTVGNLKKRKF